MKVLHCIPTLWSGSGGPTRSVLEMSNAVKDCFPEVDITIATTTYGFTREWSAVLAKRTQRVNLTTFAQVGSHTHNISGPLLWWLWRNVGRYDVVLVHSLFHPLTSAAAFITRRRGRPYIAQLHGTLSPYTFASGHRLVKRLYYPLVDRTTVQEASALLFTSEQERTKARRLGWTTPSVVIPLPVSGLRDVPIRERNPDVVLFVGRLVEKKRPDLLIDAFAVVHRQRPTARLRIAGAEDASYERRLRQQVARLGLDHAVEFMGFVEGSTKARCFGEAGIFVLPSDEENFGIVFAEAMSVGLPVVTTPGVDLWSDIDRWEAGIVVKSEVGAIADAMGRLLGDSALRYRLGENGRRLVADRYAPIRVGSQLMELYRAVAAGIVVRDSLDNTTSSVASPWA